MIGLWDYVCVYPDAGRRDVEHHSTEPLASDTGSFYKPQIYVYLYI